MVTGLPHWAFWVLGAVGAVAAMTDYRTGKIHNVLTLPALIVGLGLAALAGLTPFLESLSGVGVAAVVFIPLFVFGVMGAGDAKLVMALGSVLGATGTLELIVAAFVLGGLGSLALLIRQGRARAFFSELWAFLKSVLIPKLEIQWPKLSKTSHAPFGIALFLGYVLVLSGAI